MTPGRALRRRRYPLVATVVAAVLVVSSMTFQTAAADDQLTGLPSTPADPSTSATADPTETPSTPADEPSDEAPTEAPIKEAPASDQPTPAADDTSSSDAPASEPARPSTQQSHRSAETTAAAAAAEPTGCGYGTRGRFASTICWLDMSTYDDTQARTTAGQDMTVTLPGGYTLSYNIKTAVVSGFDGAPVLPVTTPIERLADGNSRFAFGSEAYRGIPGKPSLYSQSAPGNKGLDVTLSNISLKDSNGASVSSFAFVATDTEDNVAAASESLRWTSDKELHLIEALSTSTGKGCQPSSTIGLGTTTVSCTGLGGPSSTTDKSRSILVSADAPSTFALRWITLAQSGIAFGVQTSSIEVVKSVDGRAHHTDSFDVSVTSPSGSTLATATTGAAGSATTGPVVVIPPNDNSPFTLTDTATPASGTSLADYTHTWSCTRNGVVDPSLPTGEHTSISVPAGVGDQVVCTVTNRSLTFDGGDAPASYGTVLAGGGPRHSIPDYNSDTRTSGLMLGSKVDTELDGEPTPAAEGDDSAGVDDEDGVAFNTDVTSAGRLETVFVTASAAGFLNGWMDYDRDGDFDATERLFDDTPVVAGVNRLTYTVPSGAGFVPGASYARFRITKAAGQATSPTGAAPNGEVEDYARTLFDPTATALQQCPAGSQPQPVSIIQNPSFETRTGTFVNSSTNSINFAQNWYDAHTTGGQYLVFSPTFDSGPVEGTMPFRAGADGYGFLGGHTTVGNNPAGATNDAGEGATNTLVSPLAPGTAYVGFFSIGAGGYGRNGSGYLRLFGVSNKSVGSIPQSGVENPSGTNQESLASTPTVAPAATGVRPQWRTTTFSFTPAKAWPYLRVEARNQTPANNGSQGGQAWMNFDDFHLFSCSAVPTDFGDAPGSYGTTVAQDGPRHLISGYDATAHTSTLTLGSQVDDEAEGAPNADAGGDDTAGGDDDEDGLTSITLKAGATTASATVAVENTTGASATLHGWVDADADGVFRASEAASVTVPNGATTAALSWSGLPRLPNADTVVRLRLTSAILNDTTTTAALDERSLGAAPDGEVEDHAVTIESPTVTCTSDPAMFNTAYDGSGGKLPPGTRDLAWEFGVGNATGPASVTTWSSAYVVSGPSAWYPGAFGSASWIAHNSTAAHNNPADIYFRYRFRIAPSVTLDAFSLPMSFFADNSVPEVWVNGTAQSPYQPGVLPQSATNPYGYQGFVQANAAKTTLTEGFQHGPNEIVVRVASGGPAAGFMAEVTPNPLCSDRGDAPDSYGTAGSTGASHGLGEFTGTNTTKLMLGSLVDADGAAQPTAAANGDDSSGVDDEDALQSLALAPGATTATASIPVVNSTGSPATLYGWVDASGDGSFQASEAATIAVPDGATSATLSWTGLSPAVDGRQPVVRLRLTTATLTDDAASANLDERSQGAAPDGEVEDSLAIVAALLPNDCVNPLIETFGAGTGRASLPAGQTTYSYAATGAVNDGSYALVPGIDTSYGGWWHTGPDHTPGDTNGRAMLVNAAFVAGKFFTKTFTGFQVGSTYDFSAWITNANKGGSAILPNVRFRVVDPVSGAVLATIDTGNLPNRTSLIWTRYALSFTATQSSVRLELVNNAPGGGGNDLALDDVAIAPTCEYGDAPDSYGTLLSSNGAVHAKGSSLRLGATVDHEGDGQPTAAANGDDSSGDDEDGAGPLTVTTGSAPSIDVTVTNTTGGPATLAGWVDLDKSGTFDANERAVAAVAPATLDETVTLTFAGVVTTTQATYARLRLLPGAPANPLPTGAAPAGEVEDHAVTVLTPSLAVTKSSDSSASSKPGDTVTYTVTLTNIGNGGFTAGHPARLVDDLTGVLDDGTYRDDAVAMADGSAVTDPTYAAPRISWSGPLAAGKSVVVTYSVVLHGGGDGHVRNTAFAPLTPTPGPTPDCSAAGNSAACDREVFELPKLSITKTANRTQLPSVGQTIVYTVTVENTGLGSFTGAHPATFSDDLSDVLDDTQPLTAANITVTSGSATFASPMLSWSGTLPAGESAEITYTLTYTGAGDHALVNAACVPASEAQDPADNCRTVSVPGSGLRHHKSVDPASGTPVEVGQLLTYTLTFENVGPVAATVDTADDLSEVLDDAQLVGAPVAGSGMTVSMAGDQLDVDGSVPAGQTRTVTYQVQVRPWADQGDHVLANRLLCEPGEPSGCAPATTSNPVAHLVIDKSSDATVDSSPGDTVTYTVTALNDGPGDFTVADPATVVDDLTGVLDDATYNNDDAAADQGATPAYSAPRITWAGPLAHGDSVTIEYTVTLKGGGDGHVDNVVWQPEDPRNPGPTPDCATSSQPCAGNEFDLPKLTIKKTSNRSQLPAAGQKITYTVTVANAGPGDYTAGHPATFSDDLSDVLDDATFDAGSITATSGSADFDGTSLDWSGELAAGDSATVTYTFTYQASGDLVVDNHACIPLAEAKNPADPCRTVHTPGSGLRHFKSVDPSNGASVVEGQLLTYTLTFENVGPADATVDTFDDLLDVADDAVLDTESITADTGLTAIPNAAGDRIDITGSVPTGATSTVTYQVQVKPFADQGDHLVTNALACEPGDPDPCDPTSTTNPVRHLKVTKTSDATVDGEPGDTVSYTVRLLNDGTGDYTATDPASLVDDLTDVLDDASFNGVVHASAGPDPTYVAPRITWAGPLAAGDEVRVTYEVVLRGGGDGHVDNVAWQPGNPGNPGPTPDCATSPRPCDTESFDLPKLRIAKSSSRTDLRATGQDLTYTVVVHNPGPGDYTAAHPATVSDDLSDVLDDATEGPITASVGSASITGTTLSWTGELAANDAATITYTVTYRATGDHVLDNAACVPASEAQVPAERCDTVSVPGSGLVHAKSVDPATGTPVEVGDVLTYTLTFDNTAGATAATVDASDDVSRVLDDATLDTGSITAGDGLTATPTPVGAPTAIAVTGSVPAGATRTVTYQVTVRPFAQQGDHVVTNALACEPGEPTPCAPETTSNPVRHAVLTKVRTSPASPDTGDQVTYTVTVHNDGTGDWTAGDPASAVDDLTGVMDDATWDDSAVASDGSVSFAAPELTWTGALAAGATVTISYTVTVTNLGDHRLVNTASVTGCQLPECSPPPVVTPLPHVVPSKTSTPAAGQPVQPGDVVTYTLSWTNDGRASGVLDSTDDLTGVLDDATMVTEPTVSDPAATATRTGSSLRVVGSIADGHTVTVTYQVRVEPAGQHGDNKIANVLTPDTPQVTCAPFPCTPVPPPTVTHPVGDLDDWKSVDPVSSTQVKAGNRLTYTLHFASVGTGPVTVAREDDLSGVLDDATLVGTPTSSTPALTVTGPTAGRLAVSGTLPAGSRATVTYTVQVKQDGRRGDDRLVNFLLDPGQHPPASCSGTDANRLDCTHNQVVPLVFDLVLDKRLVASSTVETGDSVRYRLQVANRGHDTASAPIIVRDPLPTGLELVAAHGKGWDCKVKKASDAVVCRRDTHLGAGKKAPVLNVVAKVTAGATGRIVNKAHVKAAGDRKPANNRDTAPLQVAVPDLPRTGFRPAASESLRFGW